VPCSNEGFAGALGLVDTVEVVDVKVGVEEPAGAVLVEVFVPPVSPLVAAVLQTYADAKFSDPSRQSESKAGDWPVNLGANRGCEDDGTLVAAYALDTNTDVRQHAATRFETQNFRLRRVPLLIKSSLIVLNQGHDAV
jgi:hypothetical protein